jgi:hypothetical protein
MAGVAMEEPYCVSDENLDGIAWYCGNSEVTYSGCVDLGQNQRAFCAGTNPVGMKMENLWGLFDMHGNVWEYCRDGYDSYTQDFVINPYGSENDPDSPRILRGGSWHDSPRQCRSARRHTPDFTSQGIYGLRLVYEKETSPAIFMNGPPQLVSATLETDGRTWVLIFSKAVRFRSNDSGGFTISTAEAEAVNLTYGSGAGTQRLIYNSDETIAGTTAIELSYVNPGDGIEDSDGNDMASVTDFPVRNKSLDGVVQNYFEFTTNDQTWAGHVVWPGGRVIWEFGDGSVFEGENPGPRDFGSAAERTHRVTFTEPDSLTEIWLTDENQGSVISLTLGDFERLVTLRLYNCSLTDLDISRCRSLTDLHLLENPWSLDVGDHILEDLVAHNMSDGSIYIIGFYNSNNPEAINNRQILEERGWRFY